MNARRFAVGCSVTAVITVVLIVIAAVVVFRQLSAPAPLPQPSALVDEDTLGFALAHLEPGNPWILGMLEEWERNSFQRSDAGKLLPLDIAWTSCSAGPGVERHLLRLSLAPRGRLLGLVSDVALWRAGRAGKKSVLREEYGGEGITSFPALPIKGFFFVQDNSIFWASDREGAHRAVDSTAGRTLAEERLAGRPPVLALMPEGSPHALSGALSDADGSLDRSLLLISPVATQTSASDLSALSGLSFVLDPTSPDEGVGEITLHFREGTPAESVERAVREITRRLASLSFAKVSLQVEPRPSASGTTLDVRAAGLQSIYGRLASEFFHFTRTIERFAKEDGGREEALPDPNQSSSTFQ